MSLALKMDSLLYFPQISTIEAFLMLRVYRSFPTARGDVRGEHEGHVRLHHEAHARLPDGCHYQVQLGTNHAH